MKYLSLLIAISCALSFALETKEVKISRRGDNLWRTSGYKSGTLFVGWYPLLPMSESVADYLAALKGDEFSCRMRTTKVAVGAFGGIDQDTGTAEAVYSIDSCQPAQ